jgi:hypothetical protein
VIHATNDHGLERPDFSQAPAPLRQGGDIMPAILLWNIEHSGGFQDVFSSKNAFINEVIGSCVRKYDVTVVVLLEVTSEDSVDQFAYNCGFSQSIYGDGTSLKYAILTKSGHTCTDATAYFPSFSDKPRGVVHVASAPGSGIPPLVVTHIKSDLGRSGATCLADMCQQMRENMHTSPPKWPGSGVMALADWNLTAAEAVEVTSHFGGKIVAPAQPTRYPKIPANKIMQPAGDAKTLDYACVFGALKENASLTAFVPDVFYLRSVTPLLDRYLQRVVETVDMLAQRLGENEAVLNAALTGGNMPCVRAESILSDQEGLEQSKSKISQARDAIALFRERINTRDRLDEADRQIFHQLITQAGMGPDHLPVVIGW